ncbi:MAG TPA: asparagine synthase (glutamine-hydrolyzing) [Aggregatilineales bacterium]|nr:asparagine synthase (glutamine-hydrolyzing) [Anaerolineales bacterium]HRE46170.1 asparagine synthase (glutamine-hydrolyzing) [Aggregatilineales bacterium]
MCGIFGHLSPSGGDVALVERMAAALAHRGPDGFSTHHDRELAFGAGRLAIIDLSAPSGVLFNEDCQVAVVFNGEIYNHKTLRQRLVAEGHHFTTQTDTEVIVHGYEEWGVRILDELHGMFAIGVWDGRARRLLLARDRLGEKPLYYAQHGEDFLFASEIKAILEQPTFPRRVNHTSLPVLLALGYVPPPETMFEGVKKLAPGEWLTWQAGTIETGRYFIPTMTLNPPPQQAYPHAVNALRQDLFRAVESRLMSDVPLGAFLSGGVDSTAVVGIMAKLTGQPVKTFTVGYGALAGAADNAKLDAKFNADARYAAAAAAHYKTDHETIQIRQDDHLAWLLPRLVYAMDEPLAQPGIILTAYVAALARQRGVPVLLSGDAGDELFAGYPSYRADQLLGRYLRIPAFLRNRILNPLFKRLPKRFELLRKVAAKASASDPLSRFLAWNRNIDPARFPDLLSDPSATARATTALRDILLPILNTPQTPYFTDRLAYAGLRLWLAEDSNMRVDKMAMAMSIEARAPLEDHRLLAGAFQLPLSYKLRGGDFKRVFKDAVRDLVPESILTRSKFGFFPPASEWLRTILRPLVERWLSPDYVRAAGMVDPDAVARIVRAHVEDRHYELWAVWTLLVLHLWHALYISGALTLTGKLSAADVTA